MKKAKRFGLIAGILAVLTAALPMGCFAPFIPPKTGESPLEETPGLNSRPESFSVDILIGKEAAARSVAGPDAVRFQVDGLYNIFQLVVADGEGKIAGFEEQRRESPGGQGITFMIEDAIAYGKTYSFLLLMGRWEWDGSSFTGASPTLLAAGLTTQELTESGTVTVTMWPIVVDTEFTSSNAAAVEPEVQAGKPKAAELLPVDWKVQWTIQRGVGGDGLTDLMRAQQAIGGGADPLTLKGVKTLLNGKEGTGTLNKNVITQTIAASALDTAGSVNFNLEYVPFGLTGKTPNPWAEYDGKSAFNLLAGDKEPVWIIRNGVNDLAQNGATDFSAPAAWGAAANGNGAVRFTPPPLPAPPFDMVLVEEGSSLMGNPDPTGGFDFERPAHKVTLSSFSMGKHEVTQKEWYAVMETTIAQQLVLYNQDVAAYNHEVDVYNQEAEVYNQGVDSYNQGVDSYNQGVDPTHKVANFYNKEIADYNNAVAEYNKAVASWNAIGGNAPKKEYWPKRSQRSYRSYGELCGDGDNFPMYYISWFEMVAYCNKLSEAEGLTPAYTIDEDTNPWTVTWDFASSGYRLPTEAEWEYAARGGDPGDNFVYAGSNNVDEVAWYYGNSGDSPGVNMKAHPVGEKKPNGLGLYDMSGNVFERCWDKVDANIVPYPSEPQTNPTGPSSGDNRIGRGGYWGYSSDYARLARRTQGDASSRSNGTGFRVARTLPAIVTPVMQQVAGGAFSMGSTNNSPAYFQETPVHEVTLSSFSMAKHEVTQKEWYAVMGTTAADLLALRNMLYPPTEQNSYKVEVLYGEGENHPIYYVTWYEAVEYCNRLSAHEGLPPAYTINKNTDPWTVTCDFAAGYRLPTEAEWEYAARGGDSGDNFKYSGSDTLDDVAWYSGTSGGNTHPVGWKKPNGLGLYDMTGNANEWCWDWAQPNYYSISLSDNPTGPVDNSVSGDYRVTRGGDFIDGATLSTLSNLRTADRGGIAPYARLRSLGFRVVRPQP